MRRRAVEAVRAAGVAGGLWGMGVEGPSSSSSWPQQLHGWTLGHRHTGKHALTLRSDPFCPCPTALLSVGFWACWE